MFCYIYRAWNYNVHNDRFCNPEFFINLISNVIHVTVTRSTYNVVHIMKSIGLIELYLLLNNDQLNIISVQLRFDFVHNRNIINKIMQF